MPQLSNDLSQSPVEEMRVLVRRIGGALRPGEDGAARIERVARWMNRGLPAGHQLSARTVYGYWYPDSRHLEKDIPSLHWRRAVALAALVDEENRVKEAAWRAHAANDNGERLPCRPDLIPLNVMAA